MKKIISTSFLLSFTLLIPLVSCKNDKYISPQKGNATFSLTPTAREGGRIAETATPAFVLLSTRSNDGSLVQENVKIPLFAFGQSYLTESQTFVPGTYQLTQFVVLDAANKVIYASPLEGSALAKYVKDPLPMQFTIAENTNIQVIPQVLAVSLTDTPTDFGYVNFGFEVVSSSSSVLIKTKVMIGVGHIIYDNIDALIRVKGYGSNNMLQWTKDYDFIGPEDILEVKNGFHHYSIELVDKWGVNDIKSDILAKDLWDGRADGSLPNTFLLSGSKDAKKLTSTVFSVQTNVPGKGLIYEPSLRDLYSYNTQGQLASIRHQQYNSQTQQYEGNTTETFTYEGLRVAKIESNWASGRPSEEFVYEYGVDGGRTNKITWTNFNVGIVTTQLLQKDYLADHPKVLMTESFSNGHLLSYDFDVAFKNIVSDKTSNNSELCSKGIYTYDKNINPLHHLGYMDFYLQNWSANNKVSLNIDYVGCGYPSLEPVAHLYSYDTDGYPTKVATSYKTSSNSNTVLFSQTDYYYE